MIQSTVRENIKALGFTKVRLLLSCMNHNITARNLYKTVKMSV